MEMNRNYNRGLLYISYLLITSDQEISEDELYHLNKMRVEEGISDEIFGMLFTSLMEKSEQEIYQVGIDSINNCPDDQKIRIFKRLHQMAMADGILRVKEVRFVLYALKLVRADKEKLLKEFCSQEVAA